MTYFEEARGGKRGAESARAIEQKSVTLPAQQKVRDSFENSQKSFPYTSLTVVTPTSITVKKSRVENGRVDIGDATVNGALNPSSRGRANWW